MEGPGRRNGRLPRSQERKSDDSYGQGYVPGENPVPVDASHTMSPLADKKDIPGGVAPSNRASRISTAMKITTIIKMVA